MCSIAHFNDSTVNRFRSYTFELYYARCVQVIGELMSRRPLLPGANVMDQLTRICDLVSESTCTGCTLTTRLA